MATTETESRWRSPRLVFEGQYDATSVIVTLSLALALYNSIELVLLIPTTFKRWRGLYFWSLVVANYGVISYSVGLILEYFELVVYICGKIFDVTGWICMITGQSLVLYSRLNLILDKPILLKAVLGMIICNAVVWHSTILVLDFGGTYTTDESFAEGMYYIEHVQMTMFCIQEFILSGLYVWRTIAFLKVVSKSSTRNIMAQLFTINVILIAMDIALLFMQYKHWRIHQQVTKAFIYSVKLKLELNILSKLVDLVKGSQNPLVLTEIDTTTGAGQARVDLRREISASPPPKPDACHLEHGSELSQDTIYDPSAVRNDSQGSRTYSYRATGRETDILYADMLKSMK